MVWHSFDIWYNFIRLLTLQSGNAINIKMPWTKTKRTCVFHMTLFKCFFQDSSELKKSQTSICSIKQLCSLAFLACGFWIHVKIWNVNLYGLETESILDTGFWIHCLCMESELNMDPNLNCYFCDWIVISNNSDIHLETQITLCVTRRDIPSLKLLIYCSGSNYSVQ